MVATILVANQFFVQLLSSKMHTFLNGGGLNPPNPPLATPCTAVRSTIVRENQIIKVALSGKTVNGKTMFGNAYVWLGRI